MPSLPLKVGSQATQISRLRVGGVAIKSLATEAAAENVIWQNPQNPSQIQHRAPTGTKVQGERNPRSQQLKRADSISQRHRNPDMKIHRLSSLHMYSNLLKHACPWICPSCYISGCHILWLYCNRGAAVAAAVANIRTLDFCQMRK